MKRKIIITSLMMASVLPFIGGMETARADEAQNLNEKAKSELDKAQENLKAAQDEKENAEKDLAQANKDATDKKAKKENLENQLTAKQKELEENQKVLEKDKQIKKIDEEREALAPKIEKAKKDKEAAEDNFNKAKSAHEEAEKQAADKEKFVKEDKTAELNRKYDEANKLLSEQKNKERDFQNQLKENIDKQKELGNKKAGIQDVFKNYEKEKSNKDKIESQDYKDFKRSIDQEIGSIDKEIEKLKGEANGINNAINGISEGTKNFQQDRDDKLKVREQHEQAIELQKNYDAGKITDLNKLVEEKEKERQKAKNALNIEKENKEKAEAEYQGILIQEEERKNEIARLKAAAEFLDKRLKDKTDSFVKKNEASLSEEKAFYEQKSQAAEKSLDLIQKAKKENAEELQNKILDYKNEQAAFEQSENFLEVAKNFKKFIEDKKNSNYDQKVKELKNKMNEAQAELAKKAAILNELSQKDDALALEKNKLDNTSPSDIQKAKEKIAENSEEIEKLKKEIKDIEESKELAKVKNLENKIKDLDKKISDINDQIQKLKNSKPGNQNKHEIPNLEKPSLENPIKEEESEDVWKGLSEMTLEKIDEQIRQKNIRTELKIQLNKYNKLMVAAQKYVEKFTLSRDKKMDTKSYDKLKMDIRVIKKIIDIIENLIKTGDLSDQERIDFVNIIKELKMNIDLVEKSLAQL
ncbi:hypothetical protein [Anaerococcus degeneri]|uniref:Uncharacterized protein n=1 Tax=Anaerococcus degeneri TaxID=361500 RepID=A0ABS7YW90_9FIRM|nr:hypothetical protein [Anaerococcus degeneri]MBP2015634.1 chromosome segregation ATPase [Anaerococcus degeneri]MCA2095995.1 hypothetical protein [Anaerococcus degeneri]